ncbi:restriction endonuclease subunit S [Gulosibacter molinativorax]|uniref:restriction endonuclease subunit S n=1 Tax=Gulosibacter molinativorax TaxID=256821 RepID=UPI0011B22EE3|nr:hypothetical protein [Gulosibacter molinativorax]QUY63098.1 Type I restriction-modification system specificity subunit [Gulosibacter molinativorax]
MFSLPRSDRAGDGWQKRSLRSILTPRSERNRPDLPLLTVARERGVFVRSKDDANHNVIPEDLSNYKVAREGDLVINKMKAWQGSLGLAPVDGIVSPAYFVFEAEFANLKFGEYLLRSKPFVAKFAAASDGVRIGQWDLDIPRMRNIEVILPSQDEQAAIVKYLAHANARIDKAITAKRRLIALLEEQRGKVVRDILAGRLTLGETSSVTIQGWTTKRLKWVTRLQRGYDLPADKRRPGAFPVISSGGVIGTHDEPRASGPGVVMGRYGSTDAVFFVESDFWPHNTSLFVTDFQGNDPMWCYWTLRSIGKSKYSGKSAVPGIDRKDLFDIPIAVPPRQVQQLMVGEIERENVDIDRLVRRSNRETDLLQEFRTRLVADVVTGQVDVRAIAATLPDAPEAVADLVSDSDDELIEALETADV